MSSLCEGRWVVPGREVERNVCSERDSVGRNNMVSDWSLSGRPLSEVNVTDGLESFSLDVRSSSEGRRNSTDVGAISVDGVDKPSNRLVCSRTGKLVEVEYARCIVSD